MSLLNIKQTKKRIDFQTFSRTESTALLLKRVSIMDMLWKVTVHVLMSNFLIFYFYIPLFQVLASWRGHLENVTCISIVDEPEMVLTSSLDCTVRLWTTKGHYVGEIERSDFGVHRKSRF